MPWGCPSGETRKNILPPADILTTRLAGHTQTRRAGPPPPLSPGCPIQTCLCRFVIATTFDRTALPYTTPSPSPLESILVSIFAVLHSVLWEFCPSVLRFLIICYDSLVFRCVCEVCVSSEVSMWCGPTIRGAVWLGFWCFVVVRKRCKFAMSISRFVVPRAFPSRPAFLSEACRRIGLKCEMLHEIRF